MSKEKQRDIKGVRIRTANFFMIGMSCVLYILLLAATIHVSARYKDVHFSMDDYIACERNGALLREGSAYLTEQVRLYTVTADPQYMEDYFQEVQVARRREQALEALGESHSEETAYSYLVSALERSNELVEQEIQAMRLVLEASGGLERAPVQVREVQLPAEDEGLPPEELLARARELVFGPDYQAAKEGIEGDLERSLSSIHTSTHQRMLTSTRELEETMSRQRLLISALFIETIVTFIMIILLIVKPLQIYVKCIREDKLMEIVGSYEFKYLALTYNDIYEVNTANENMLRYRAEHDPLTGLVNRSAFDHLKQILQARSGPVALLLVDVDNFKQINDGWGHDVGDKVLKEVARLLGESFRNTDCPARIGGDEFAVILPDMTPERRELIERKVAGMNASLTHPSQGLPPVSLSVGGAFSPQGFTDDLYKKADLALYEVKEHGRCGCRFYSQDAEGSD